MLPDFIVKLSLLIVPILIGIAILRHKLYYHFSVVEKGKLYRSGALNALRLRLVVRRAAIRTVINLASQEECAAGRWYEEEKEFCRQNQLNLINIPIRPGLPPDPEQIRRFFADCSLPRLSADPGPLQAGSSPHRHDGRGVSQASVRHWQPRNSEKTAPLRPQFKRRQAAENPEFHPQLYPASPSRR